MLVSWRIVWSEEIEAAAVEAGAGAGRMLASEKRCSLDCQELQGASVRYVKVITVKLTQNFSSNVRYNQSSAISSQSRRIP